MSAPTLAPGTSVLRHGEKLVVRSGDQAWTISGDDMVHLVESLLAGSDDGVLPTMPTDSPAWSSLVELLRESGLVSVEEGMTQASPSARLLWQRSGQVHPLRDVDAALRESVVPVLGKHPLAARVRSILEDSGVGVTDDGREARACAQIEGSVAPAVVVAGSVDDVLLTEHNTWALETGLPWLPVVLDDAGHSVVGPYIRPHSSACLRCYRLRRAANFPDRRVIEDLAGAEPVAMSPMPTDMVGLSWFVAALAVEKVTERIALGDHSTMSCPGGLAALERSHPGVKVTEHKVLRVPRCPDCSTTAQRGLPQVWHHGGVSQ